jgi:Fe-S oxidoreductase
VLSLQWKPQEMQLESNHCNGCGQCRTEDPAERMCPIFRGTHGEAATPRAKANLLRSLLDGGEGNPPISAEAVRDVADLCVNCRMCASECPAHVNVPKLMLEAKAANVAAHGMSRSDWFFARLPSLAHLGQSAAFVANAALRSRTLRWLLEKTVGLSARRKLPRFASQSFLALAKRRGWTQVPANRDNLVVYFFDWYANYVDPQLAEAAVLVLQHHGYRVFVPPDQLASGIEALALGDADTAKEMAQRNLRVLADLARQEVPIVCTEPAAALMLMQDYPNLLDDEDARVIARQTIELTAFLGERHRLGKLDTRLRPMNVGVGHHVPCHVKATQAAPWGPRLLALIPDLRVYEVDVSCSGMAGTFGLQRENVAVSLAAGAPMIAEMRRPRVLHGSTECSSCRLQIEDAAGKRTLHPVQYLALAYGLMPELQQRLQNRGTP